MGCGKSVAAVPPGAGSAETSKVVKDAKLPVEVRSVVESPAIKPQLGSRQTTSGRNYGGVYVGIPSDAATLAFSRRKVGQGTGSLK
ncbi:overexpressed in colon carcinoma 1 protein [Ambystoma mexicanum]|uniref:overexpressed in colon carcinoma 1 protein n=1 Tax=Ambystoma mexicanum TaxID=8296 RepID=UPI0037E8AC0B